MYAVDLLDVGQLDLHHKRVLLRVALCPASYDELSVLCLLDWVRNIQYLLRQQAGVLLVAHVPAPHRDQDTSFQPVASFLSEHLGVQVRFAPDPGSVGTVAPGDVVLLENTLLLSGKPQGDNALASLLAMGCDVLVFDALDLINKPYPLARGLVQRAPEVCTSVALSRDIALLNTLHEEPRRPFLVALGDNPCPDRPEFLVQLLRSHSLDGVILGGQHLHGLLHIAGAAVQHTLSSQQIEQFKKLRSLSFERGFLLPYPSDVIVSSSLGEELEPFSCDVSSVPQPSYVLDVGLGTRLSWERSIRNARTLVWSGAMGCVRPLDQQEGSLAVARTLMNTSLCSWVIGEEAMGMMHRMQGVSRVTRMSLAGDALWSCLLSETMPTLDALAERMAVVC